MKKKIAIIGQFPPPIHGLSKALDTLCNSYIGEEYELYKIDIKKNSKILRNIYKILISDADLYYFTISQSKFGNLRDLLITKIIQMKNKKILIHLHGGGFRNLIDNNIGYLQKKINFKLINKVNGAIVLGDSLKYIFNGMISRDKLYVVKNCVDNEFVINETEFNKKIDDFKIKNKMNILYLSNFVEEKGYKEVLNLCKYCNSLKDKRFKFIFAGKFFDRDDENSFFEYINKNNLNELIEYHGVVQGKRKKELLSKSDYFILPTRYKNEGQPISIIEAAVNGLRIISTNHAGIKDILDNEEMILINKNNIKVKDIYKILNIEYLNRKDIVKSIISNRDKMLSEFTEEKYIDNMMKVFQITFK